MDNSEIKDNEVDTVININILSDIECESECLCPMWNKKKKKDKKHNPPQKGGKKPTKEDSP